VNILYKIISYLQSTCLQHEESLSQAGETQFKVSF